MKRGFVSSRTSTKQSLLIINCAMNTSVEIFFQGFNRERIYRKTQTTLTERSRRIDLAFDKQK